MRLVREKVQDERPPRYSNALGDSPKHLDTGGQEMQLVHEKRQHERENLVRCAKVYDRQARRYRPAQTLNVSAGGALLAVRLGEEMKHGQLVDLAIEWGGRGGLMSHSDLIPSQVVRNEGSAAENAVVAVRFNSQQVLSAAA